MSIAKIGRPSIYTKELRKEICDAIAGSSKGLKQLCKENEHFPSKSNLFEWLKKNVQFQDSYVVAKQRQIEVLVDEIISIADDASEDVILLQDGGVRSNPANIQRARLMIDTRKWLACKLVPKVYGNRPTEDKADTHEQALKELM